MKKSRPRLSIFFKAVEDVPAGGSIDVEVDSVVAVPLVFQIMVGILLVFVKAWMHEKTCLRFPRLLHCCRLFRLSGTDVSCMELSLSS